MTSKANNELSKREHEVLELIKQAKTNKEICDILHVSLPTVKTHVSSILKKKSVKTRTKLLILKQDEEDAEKTSIKN